LAAKAAARRRTGDDDTPAGPEVIKLTPATDDTRVPLFEVDGETYTIMARPQAEIALQYLHLTQTKGDAAASHYLLGELLGEDGYTALRRFKGLQDKQFRQIVTIAAQIALGSAEPDPKSGAG